MRKALGAAFFVFAYFLTVGILSPLWLLMTIVDSIYFDLFNDHSQMIIVRYTTFLVHIARKIGGVE